MQHSFFVVLLLCCHSHCRVFAHPRPGEREREETSMPEKALGKERNKKTSTGRSGAAEHTKMGKEQRHSPHTHTQIRRRRGEGLPVVLRRNGRGTGGGRGGAEQKEMENKKGLEVNVSRVAVAFSLSHPHSRDACTRG